ncbi:MAG: SCP2 sterol-binding domain-containing protein [Desulfomonile tiedjei]|nr:SCP2 sterol-binding domain-containing protein [Desulfomonile tiedjei]
MSLEDHPTVKWYQDEVAATGPRDRHHCLDAQELRELCIQAGADDAGFVEIDRPALADQKADLLYLMPSTRTIASLVFRLNREPLRTLAHSVTNLEFSSVSKQANATARTIVSALERRGIRCLNTTAGFPYEADRWLGQTWLTCDKILAEQAGLGRMGWNRLVIHPEFGDGIMLANVLLDAEVSSNGAKLKENPCLECKLCVSVCPTGAIAQDGHFDFVSCYTHNYRERLGGFSHWIETIVSSKNPKEYRKRVTDAETISMWQNLSIGPQTRCDRCMAVCPAGKEVIGEYLSDRKGYVQSLVKPMKAKEETIYAVAGSDAEAHVKARLSHKRLKRVSNGLRPSSTQGFLRSLPIVFQRNQSEGLNATFHFTFVGAEPCKGTAVIRDRKIEVFPDHVGSADLHLTADSNTWLKFLAKETSLPWALITRKIRIKGSPKLMAAFARCFPA